jgi:hypothetical protein
MTSPGSATNWIGQLRAGEQAAEECQRLLDRLDDVGLRSEEDPP